LAVAQVAQFRRDGFLFLRGLFSAAEVSALRRDALRFARPGAAHKFDERDGSAVRVAHAPHWRSRLFSRLGRHPRLVEPARKLLGREVYLHQLKINYKAAFNGGSWAWHQDFAMWHRQDGMPRPAAVAAALFLDDVTSTNGPMMLIPGSHRSGRLGAERKERSRPLLTLPDRVVERLARGGGIHAPTGPAGSVVLFHPNMAHASGSNLTPWGRIVAFVVLNGVDNAIRRPTRPDWLALRDFSPIEPLADDCLRRGRRAC